MAYPTLGVACRVEENEAFEDEARRFVPLGHAESAPKDGTKYVRAWDRSRRIETTFSCLRLACRRRVIEKRAIQVLLFMLMRSVR